MSATEELRKMLDERGIKWWDIETFDYDESHTLTECVVDGIRHRYRMLGNKCMWSSCLEGGMLTPTQAIAATLGDKYAEAEEWLRKFQREHDELRTIGPDELWALAAALHDDIPFGYEASMRLADWLFHTTLGPGTCTVECLDDGIDEALDGSPIYTTPTWYLSCGHTCEGAERPSFCPNCGRKVTQP